MPDASKALLLDIEDVAREVGSRARVYELLGTEDLQAVKVGTSTKILGDSYREFVKRLPPAKFTRPHWRNKASAPADVAA